MLQLFFDRTCPFCQRVLQFIESKGIPYEAKEMSLRSESPERDELIRLSGRTQVPYLVDPEHDVKMPESADIMRYLDSHQAS